MGQLSKLKRLCYFVVFGSHLCCGPKRFLALSSTNHALVLMNMLQSTLLNLICSCYVGSLEGKSCGFCYVVYDPDAKYV
jgi:hypothetical protein